MVEHNVQRVQQLPLHEVIYREIKHLLLTQRFEPGTRLNTMLLERQLGVSRTPLKDALNRLATEGFIDVRPRRGYFVRQPTRQDADELYDLRLLHECFAAERAVARAAQHDFEELQAILNQQRLLAVAEPSDEEYEAFSQLDREFHRRLVAAAGNQRLAGLYDQLDAHIQMARVYYAEARTTMPQTFQEHEQIFAALRQRDAEQLRQRMVAHLERFRGLVVRSLEGTDGNSSTPQKGEGSDVHLA